MKKFSTPLLFCLLALLLAALPACASRAEYSDGLSCESLMGVAQGKISAKLGFTELGNEQILYAIDEADHYDDACLRYSLQAGSIDEVGIFHSPSEQSAMEIEDELRDYLEDMREEQGAFLTTYAPEELPKLEEAEIRRFGRYTVYAILSKEEREAVFRALSEQLSTVK